MVKLAKLSPLLLLFLILPVQNQLFVDDDPVDYLEAWNGHFANPVIQVRTFMAITVNWLSRFIAWVLLGSVWAHIRGDQYDYNINSTVLFNYAMSDTKGFQNSLKSGSYALILIGIWQLLPKLGSPIPVPQRVPPIGGRGRREAGGEEEWEISGDVFYRSPAVSADISNNMQTFSDETTPSPLWSGGSASQPSPPPDFIEDVLIPAINQNLEPNGIGRNTLISTVLAMAQTIFWLACTLFLPQI